jgi:phosphoglycerate dehydrogenase-like enzyme
VGFYSIIPTPNDGARVYHVFACAPARPREQVLALPHCGNTTEEVYARNAELLRDNIVAAREGTELRHRLC